MGSRRIKGDINPRLMAKLNTENAQLEEDISQLTDGLNYFEKVKNAEQSSVRGLIRREVGGSTWEHGAEGKLNNYKSNRDLKLKQSTKPQTHYSKAGSVKRSKDNQTHDKYNISGGKLKTKHSIPTGGDLKTVSGGQLDLAPSVDKVEIKKPAQVKNKSSSSLRTGNRTEESKDGYFVPKEQSLGSFNFDPTSTLQINIKKKPITKNIPSTEPIVIPQSGTVNIPNIENISIPPLLLQPSTNHCDQDISCWLQTLHLKNPEKYEAIFSQHELDLESLKLVTEEQLREMGVTAIGAINKLLFAIKELRGEDIEEVLTARNMEERGLISGNKVKETKTKISENSSSIKVDPASQKSGGNNKISAQKSGGNRTSKDHSTRPSSSKSGTRGCSGLLKAKATGGGGLLKATGTSRVKSAPVKRTAKSAPPKSTTSIQQSTTLPRGSLQVTGDVIQSTNKPVRREREQEDSTNIADISTESVLLGLEAQVQRLQSEEGVEQHMTSEMIDRLEGQLKQVQQQISEKKRLMGMGMTSSDADAPGTIQSLAPSKSGDGVTKSSKNYVENSKKFQSVSMSMSKRQLVDQARRDKDESRRHIRHLESELERVKYKNPVGKVELNREDITFTQRDELGEGAFSVVYRGSYQGSEVAIKQLKVPLTSQDKNYFAAEVSLLRELRHPRVVLLLGVCTTTKLPLMVLEYMSGGSLYNILHDHTQDPLDHVAFYQIARDISLGMNYLHKHKPCVLHLDLKSLNVLLGAQGRAKIADFGFSKFRHDASVLKTTKSAVKPTKESVKGTPGYMAPEMLSVGDVTPKSDVYSFGIILWEMVTRQHPYKGCSLFQIIERVRKNKRPDIPASCPGQVESLIIACWHQNPSRRPSFQAILETLENMSFPQSWRNLFNTAGVPPQALHNMESARDIINLVNTTLEGVPESNSESSLDGIPESNSGATLHGNPGYNNRLSSEISNSIPGSEFLDSLGQSGHINVDVAHNDTKTYLNETSNCEKTPENMVNRLYENAIEICRITNKLSDKPSNQTQTVPNRKKTTNTKSFSSKTRHNLESRTSSEFGQRSSEFRPTSSELRLSLDDSDENYSGPSDVLKISPRMHSILRSVEPNMDKYSVAKASLFSAESQTNPTHCSIQSQHSMIKPHLEDDPQRICQPLQGKGDFSPRAKLEDNYYNPWTVSSDPSSARSVHSEAQLNSARTSKAGTMPPMSAWAEVDNAGKTRPPLSVVPIPPPLPSATELKLHLDKMRERKRSLSSEMTFGQGQPTSQGHLTSQGQTRHSKPPMKNDGPVWHIPRDDLIKQRTALKSTSSPHPNQLRDLSDVSQEQLDSIASILRKAVSERREAMKEDPQSAEFTTSGWSLTDI